MVNTRNGCCPRTFSYVARHFDDKMLDTMFRVAPQMQKFFHTVGPAVHANFQEQTPGPEKKIASLWASRRASSSVWNTLAAND
jgi:hypothetical protein